MGCSNQPPISAAQGCVNEASEVTVWIGDAGSRAMPCDG